VIAAFKKFLTSPSKFGGSRREKSFLQRLKRETAKCQVYTIYKGKLLKRELRREHAELFG
jgi:hypothetical protein